jgi:poly(hydroxyalkanoate) granule-associated protein
MTTRKSSSTSTHRAPAAGRRLSQSANKIWLAGLGAFSLAEEEGGKLFKSLVHKGEKFEEAGKEKLDQARATVEALAMATRHKLESATEEVRERAGDAFGKVEDQLDARVAHTLQALGVPTRGEIARLTRRIEELTELVEKKTARKPRQRAKAVRSSAR